MSCARRTFTEEFKQQIIPLYNTEEFQLELTRKYEVTPSALEQ